MLIELSVDNLAIISRAHLELGSGFTAVTGETGAGKSLLVDALELVLGERADADLVRDGATKAIVQAVFDLSGQTEIAAFCLELGLSVEDGLLYVQREIAAEGRSQCRVGGKLTPVSQLRQVSRRLLDLCGQHDHQSLLDREAHVDFLDAWIGEEAAEAKRAMEISFGAVRLLRATLAEIERGSRERAQRLDLLKFQVEEIESIGPLPGEYREIEARIGRMKHVGKIADAVRLAVDSLADEGATDGLRAALGRVNEVRRFDADLAGAVELLEAALANADEAACVLRRHEESLEDDPQALEDLAARLDSLRKLAHKYGDSQSADPMEPVLAHLELAATELQRLQGADESRESLSAELETAERIATEEAARLTHLRKTQSERFEADVACHLEDLAMERARFETSFQTRAIDATGADEIEFLFSANVGEPLRPMAKIASGGEISRLMLAIRAASANRAGAPTLIFDEVDSGLSGMAAAAVARKLSDLAKHAQVIAISHLPQMAAKAETHFHVEKREVDGRVIAKAIKLTNEQRIEEIARLVAGDRVTDTARDNARALLEVS